MRGVLAVSRVTLMEGLRNRALYGIFILALLVMGVNVMLAGFFMQDIGKVAVDLNLSALSFCGLLLVFFVSINLLAKDIDRKTVHVVLTQPLSRTSYIAGKFLGLCAVLLCAELLLMVLASGTVAVLRGLYGQYFLEFSWFAFSQGAFFVLLKLWLLCAFVVLFSTLTSSSFVALIFSVSVYVIGESIEEVVFYLKSSAGFDFLPLPEFFIVIVDWLSYVIPNLSVFDVAQQAAHGQSLTGAAFWFPIVYALVYSVALLFLASAIFARREFN